MIPHKVLNIRCYICTYLALFFIFVFIRLLEYQILQFHAYLLCFSIIKLSKIIPNDVKNSCYNQHITYLSSQFISLLSGKNCSIVSIKKIII